MNPDAAPWFPPGQGALENISDDTVASRDHGARASDSPAQVADDDAYAWHPAGADWGCWESRSAWVSQQPKCLGVDARNVSQQVGNGGCYPRLCRHLEWPAPTLKQPVERQGASLAHHDLSSSTCCSTSSQEDAASDSDATSFEQPSSIPPPPPFAPPPPPPPQRVPGTLTFGYDDVLDFFVVRWTVAATALASAAPLISPPFGLARSAGGPGSPVQTFTMELHRVAVSDCIAGRVQLRCHSAAAEELEFAIVVGETTRATSSPACSPVPHDFAKLSLSRFSEAREWNLEGAAVGAQGCGPRTLALRLLVSRRPSRI